MIIALLIVHAAILLAIPLRWPLKWIVTAIATNTLAFVAIAVFLVTRS